MASFLAAGAADYKWALVTQNGESVLMSDVGYILNSDNIPTFTIVKKDNSTIDDVTKITFAQIEAAGINNPQAIAKDAVYAKVVKGTLSIRGCKTGALVEIFSANGQLCRQDKVLGEHADIDVSQLASGIYLLRVGKTTVKFQKQ
ncbi:MAG: T9SS type A sorting domain-containing protein [Prevotella sp.]|nr:T9SS type A sorting domain-containing protein [Prevotella sp.]